MGPDDFGDPFNLPNHPVAGVTWDEAMAFCRMGIFFRTIPKMGGRTRGLNGTSPVCCVGAAFSGQAGSCRAFTASSAIPRIATRTTVFGWWRPLSTSDLCCSGL